MILDTILEAKKQEIEKAKTLFTIEELRSKAERFEDQTPSFKNALTKSKEVQFICELKQKSPSKGLLRKDFDYQAIARTYHKCGAAAISVLTDTEFFSGNLTYLETLAGDSPIPLLRKDFIIDPFQVYESEAFGADAFLLIARILAHDELTALIALGKTLGLDALVEVHSKADIEKALAAKAEIIGINNRDLDTFKVDIDMTRQLLPLIPDGVIAVSESGIHSREDIVRLQSAGVNAVLIGEALMRAEDIATTLKRLMGKS